MAVKKAKKAKKASRSSTSGRFSPGHARRIGGYEVLGRTDEGIFILRPRFKSDSFSWEELDSAVRSTRFRRG
jgi:hypothetical protein